MLCQQCLRRERPESGGDHGGAGSLLWRRRKKVVKAAADANLPTRPMGVGERLEGMLSWLMCGICTVPRAAHVAPLQ